MSWARTMAQAERELAVARPDCVLLDLQLPDASRMDALDRIASRVAGWLYYNDNRKQLSGDFHARGRI